MKTFEILCVDRDNLEKHVNVIARNSGDALIEFRKQYDLDNWRVQSLSKINVQQVLDTASR